MILRVPWRHFRGVSKIFISRKNPIIYDKISNSYRDELHW